MTAVLVIAGTDSSGGAGLARDIRVLHHFGAEALPCVTAVTAQSNTRVAAVHNVPPEVIRAQILAAFETRGIDAVKIGMLGNRATIEAMVAAIELGSRLQEWHGPGEWPPVVLDPVLVSSSGGSLLDPDGQQALRELLLPRVTLLTPNIPEAAGLLHEPLPADTCNEQPLIEQGVRLLDLGSQAVLLKGGHATGAQAVDWLLTRHEPVQRLLAPRAPGSRRGTGCALASGIAAGLAQGLMLRDCCERAKHHVLTLFQSTP